MNYGSKILITGGTGLIGTRLTTLLLERGYRVAHLVRSPEKSSVEAYRWQPHENFIEEGALDDVQIIVHLAGMDIASKRWNKKVKDEILFSRAGTAKVLFDHLEKRSQPLSAFISASGISYYGTANTGRAFDETDSPADDFMARVTVAWEQQAHAFKQLGARVVMLRTGVVLSPTSGALKKLAEPIRFFVGAPLGSGQQMTNWIHLDDVCRIYMQAIEDQSMSGPINAVAPHPVTNESLTLEIARVLKRPLWAPRVPKFLVRAIAGEVAYVVLEGGPVSARKLLATGFTFQYPTLPDALTALYKDNQ